MQTLAELIIDPELYPLVLVLQNHRQFLLLHRSTTRLMMFCLCTKISTLMQFPDYD
jgi:hypothetical protein